MEQLQIQTVTLFTFDVFRKINVKVIKDRLFKQNKNFRHLEQITNK